jgi:hypothetical protein
MRYGHSVNSAIPENPDEAEFPPTPWPDEVTIRIKSQAPPQNPAAGDGLRGSSPAPDLPPGWKGPALGQAGPISAEAAGLADYTSPYSARTVEGQPEEPPDEELLRLRGEARGDDKVHHMISWTTRKDYPLMVGISLPIPDLSIERATEAQLWEETDEEWVITANHAEFAYMWLMDRLTSRSTQRMLPVGMPEAIDEVTVATRKDGKAGHILSSTVAESETKILIEYDHGYMLEGTGNAYTIRMISEDFMVLTQNTWELYPAFSYRRLIDGTIVHKCTTDYREGQQILTEDVPATQPTRVLEERGRGTEIHSITDQGRILQYWALERMPFEVGIMFPTPGRVTEFWMWMTLQPEPDDGDPMMYQRIIKMMWMKRLRTQSPRVAATIATVGEDFGVKMRYLLNGLRIWFVPNISVQAGINRSLAEDPGPKDKWYSTSDLMAFSFPPLPDDQIGELPSLLFGDGRYLQERYAEHEVQGGKIALIAFKQKRVQKPLNFLDRMRTTFLRQVAHNQRIIKAEQEISGINCDIADFVAEMTMCCSS